MRMIICFGRQVIPILLSPATVHRPLSSMHHAPDSSFSISNVFPRSCGIYNHHFDLINSFVEFLIHQYEVYYETTSAINLSYLLRLSAKTLAFLEGMCSAVCNLIFLDRVIKIVTPFT